MEPDLNNPEQIKLLIKMLQGLLPKDNEEIIKQKTKPKKVVKSQIKTKTRKAKQESTGNKFLDMPERNMHKSDTKIDQKLCTQPPCPRNRMFEPVEVRCRSCGKQEKVNPVIIPESVDRYKCNKCASSAGG